MGCQGYMGNLLQFISFFESSLQLTCNFQSASLKIQFADYVVSIREYQLLSETGSQLKKLNDS